MKANSDRPMDSKENVSPLGGLSPADLLRQGAADDTMLDGRCEAFEPPSLEELAAIFPQFEILGLIGQGGMGAVYKVRQRQLDRVVALKILPPGIGGDATFADRFAREAKALAKLNHPGIVTIHEFGCSGGLYFIVMEFVDGVNLRQLLKGGRISPREALAIVPQICDALQFAHDLGIVHRDIKPENLLIDRRGRVKVADFGLAKLVGGETEAVATGGLTGSAPVTEAGKVMGTPDYMAPEQIERPEEVDHRADIYAVGVVFYQMLTGELPGERLEAPSRKVSVDVRLDEIVLRALEKDPELRFQQVSAMKTRVEETREQPVSSRGAGRVRWGVALQAAGLLLLLAGFSGMLRPSGGAQITAIYELKSGDPEQVAITLERIVREQGPNATLARRFDGRGWWISVHHRDRHVANEEMNRIEKGVVDSLDETEGGFQEIRTVDASIMGAWGRVRPGYLLAGVWAGLAGALLLVSARSGHAESRTGKIALGFFLAALAGTGGMFSFAPMQWRHHAAIFGGAALLIALGCGLAGRNSRQGRIALAGVWVVVFLWAVSVAWGYIVLPHPRPPGFEIVPLDRAATGDPVISASAILMENHDWSFHREGIAEPWLQSIDRGDFGPAYAALAPAATSHVSAEQWASATASARSPLGALVSREFMSREWAGKVTGAAEGESMMVRFKTRFEDKDAVVETVVLVLDGNDWKPAGYFIR
jgi:predicted Ser/Thr protein kinase